MEKARDLVMILTKIRFILVPCGSPNKNKHMKTCKLAQILKMNFHSFGNRGHVGTTSHLLELVHDSDSPDQCRCRPSLLNGLRCHLGGLCDSDAEWPLAWRLLVVSSFCQNWAVKNLKRLEAYSSHFVLWATASSPFFASAFSSFWLKSLPSRTSWISWLPLWSQWLGVS